MCISTGMEYWTSNELRGQKNKHPTHQWFNQRSSSFRNRRHPTPHLPSYPPPPFLHPSSNLRSARPHRKRHLCSSTSPVRKRQGNHVSLTVRCLYHPTQPIYPRFRDPQGTVWHGVRQMALAGSDTGFTQSHVNRAPNQGKQRAIVKREMTTGML